jgi:hypothetical protein
LMASQGPLGAGAASLGSDISVMTVHRGAYHAKFRRCRPPLRNLTGLEPLGWSSRGQSLKEAAIDDHSRQSSFDVAFAGRPTALAARVSMVSRKPCTVSGAPSSLHFSFTSTKEHSMNSIVYLVGAVVIIIAVLSFFGMR